MCAYLHILDFAHHWNLHTTDDSLSDPAGRWCSRIAWENLASVCFHEWGCETGRRSIYANTLRKDGATNARVRWFYNPLLWHNECLWVEPAALSPNTPCHLCTQGKDLPRTSSEKPRPRFRTTLMFSTLSCSDFEILRIVTLWSTSMI